MLVKARFMFGPMDGLEKTMKKPLSMLLWVPLEVDLRSLESFSHKSIPYELVFHDEETAVYRWKP